MAEHRGPPQSSFKHERPFEREIEGIKQFEPISRTHPGLVAILHVGRSSDGDCFYYVMELGDDINTGTDIEPETYQGKTLANAVWDRGALSADRCIDLGLSLSDALAHLHSKDLIHRDVKPANIIFVAGYPKLADIGLVTEAHTASTYVGTEGFIPPEGPNSPQGDVFSLGKTLYEILTGQDRNQFPALPASFANDGPPDSNYVELIEIINHACHHDRAVRYASARAMHAEITALANGRSIRRLRLLERRMSFISRFSKLAALFILPCLLVAYTIHREWQGRLQDLHREIGSYEGMAANEMSAGDLSTALLHVGQAFGLAPYDESNASLQRLRAGTVFDSSPTLTHFWLSDASINRIEFDRANEFLFVAGDSGLVGRYSMSEDVLKRFVGHIGDVRDIALHEESGRLLSVGGDHTVRLWDLESGQELRVFDQNADLWCVKFSPDGRMAYSGGGVSPEGGSIYRWNLDETDSGTPVHIYPHLEKAWDLEISADGGILALIEA